MFITLSLLRGLDASSEKKSRVEEEKEAHSEPWKWLGSRQARPGCVNFAWHGNLTTRLAIACTRYRNLLQVGHVAYTARKSAVNTDTAYA